MPHVLVVDDNPLSLRFFDDALAAIGIACTGAGDGTRAINLAARQRFDLLLIDARMPAPDGVQTLRAIRSGTGASRMTPAIATTAADGTPPADLFDAGFIEVIGKPVALDSLRASLARHLSTLTVAERRLAETPALLDDARALAAAGDDATIVSALRGLLSGELDALPAELAVFAASRDLTGLRERLHRLAASAGFCGASGLAGAVQRLHLTIDVDTADLEPALNAFLATCRATHAALLTTRDQPGS